MKQSCLDSSLSSVLYITKTLHISLLMRCINICILLSQLCNVLHVLCFVDLVTGQSRSQPLNQKGQIQQILGQENWNCQCPHLEHQKKKGYPQTDQMFRDHHLKGQGLQGHRSQNIQIDQIDLGKERNLCHHQGRTIISAILTFV